MLDRFAIDARDTIPYQSSQVMGIFEPVTGVLFLNVDDAQFDRWRGAMDSDPQLTETFWHEAYHCFQSYATGYCYARCIRLAAVFGANLSREGTWSMLWRIARFAASDRLLSWASWPLSATAREMLAEARRLRANADYVAWLSARSQRHARKSIWGALHPALQAALHEVDLPFRERGPAGISANDIVEGSAFLYGHEVRSGGDGSESPRVDPTLDEDGPYQRLVRASLERRPRCTSRAMRLASALALRYAVPGEAYLPLLDRVSDAAPGDDLQVARAIGAALPALDGAGEILGTGREHRARHRPGYRIYDGPLDQLERQAWGIDELDLLAGPSALDSVPPGELGFSLTTRNGIRRASRNAGGGPAAVVIASMMLPTGPSVAKLRRSFRMGLPA